MSATKGKGWLSRVLQFTRGLRAVIVGAVAEEQVRSEEESVQEDEKDLFDRLPDPPPHLEIGDVKYFDGKFRYF